jgi:hypothetical protein
VAVAILVAGVAGVAGAGCARLDAGDSPGADPAMSIESASGTLSSTLDQIVLTVVTDPQTVDSGRRVQLTAMLRNDRPTPVAYGLLGCGFASVEVSPQLPFEPFGKAWAGRAGWFKDFVLNHGYAAGGAPATEPAPVTLFAGGAPCDGLEGSESTLLPGQLLTNTFSWPAEVVTGLRAAPGAVPFTVTAGFDRQNGPPSYEPGYTGIRGSWVPMYKQLSVRGHLTVVGEAPDAVSGGEALDALLEDEGFVRWLEGQAPGTCDTANLILANNHAGGIIPPGPAWDIELFCESGVERHFAIAAVDAISGKVTLLDVCSIPCGR